MMWNDTNNLNALIRSRGGFVKETIKPDCQTDANQKVHIDAAQKAILNRKGNILFNDGNFEGAKRVFITTGYSDGLSRIGDYYRKEGRVIDALQMYRIAHDKKKADEIMMNLALLIKLMLSETVPLSEGVV